ncbi:unnamed protein product [Candidula unifasciata]|uniref:Bcl-2 Bcl-2 homology region 1-3 domain-containing protein n=1 Tax=Candidula unifasciata TaxID=100452 RepID=A0A8S3ZCQ1_9EUPU|nr:unnamed protein product [Candidula unifasciata]
MAYSIDGSEFNFGPDQEPEQRINGSRIRFSSPSVAMVQVRSGFPVMHQDTEENVGAQTEEVFRNYVYQRYRNDTMREEVDSLPRVPELMNFTATPMSPAAEIGRHLARMGDELNTKYANEFDQLISALHLTDDAESTYEAFASIGRRVFANRNTWAHIMLLLSFGYRIAITKLRQHAVQFASFLGRIATFLCRFVMSERIARWIAEQGGWRAALNYIPSASSGTGPPGVWTSTSVCSCRDHLQQVPKMMLLFL